MRRVAAFVRRRRPASRSFEIAGLVRIDRGADLRGVGLVEQAVERVLDEVRVAEVAVAVDVGVAHRLDLIVHRLRRAEARVLERIALEDVEDLADDHAARARRRRGDDVIAAVVAFDRRELARRVLVEVGLRDEALAGAARGDDGARDRALVEAVGARLARSGAASPARSFCTSRSPGAVRLAARLEEDRARVAGSALNARSPSRTCRRRPGRGRSPRSA